MEDFMYKGWRVELQSKPAPDVAGAWRSYVTVVYNALESLRSVPLSFKDDRTFSTKEAADNAGAEMARVWIDRQ